ncbi:hypothetical protein TanjilG_05763 [Lupinus angustifolius]|uniref:VQ domain-containing protein n=1 Tax=Lupinus angustifolius TaxID=3871 RepID=A0A4P1R499_LUPAN|nr:PREDICTED: uncharacterized protein DDB_G0292186-like [Lupinus angustifolius]OIW00413.1 hypothetical protein TanjilG_05763 [Lupinus angustifolius]
MDSGNSSSSLQSSNGGDDESSSFSAFLNNNPPPQTPTLFNTSSTNHNMFDPLSSYLDPTQPSPLLNLDMMWSKNHRSEPNPTYLPSSSSFSPSPHNQEAFPSRDTTCSAFLNTANTTLLQQESGSRGLVSSVSAATNNDQGHNSNMVRNPKKRSRASRRAPTTVLTTDTTNFRAMVQEFTGIPAPPFTSSSSSSHLLRTRFDLFAPHHAAKPSTSTLLDHPPYLLRPSAQKVQQPLLPIPPSSSSSIMDTLLLALNNSANPFNNMHNNNPNINPSFQNILQQPQQQPSLETPQPNDGHLKMGVFEELGLRHAHVNNNNNNINININGLQHQNMVSSGNNNNSSNTNTNTSSMDQWAHKTDTANYASSSDFHGEKVPETTTTVATAARSEGMVESWINCSSDN